MMRKNATGKWLGQRGILALEENTEVFGGRRN
jgi:hypothetical protein